MTSFKKTEYTIVIFAILVAVLFFAFYSTVKVHAQGVGTEQVLVDFTPQFPKPNDNVSVNLTSYSGDLDRAKITWFLNGKIVNSGVGKKTFSFKVGPAGSPTTFGVMVSSDSFAQFEKYITLNPAQVDILWQTLDSYTPPFYRGKALPVRMSKIRAVAMPEMKTSRGDKVKSNEVVYKWTRDDNPMLESSGFAKNYADFSFDFTTEDATLKVGASSVKEGGLSAENTVYFNTVDPKILFYENKPLLGINYGNALVDSFDLKNDEVELVAEPYYFTSANGLSNLSYEWLINNAPAQNTNQKSIILRIGDQKKGTSDLSLQIRQAYRFLQVAGKSLKLNFGN